MKEKRRRKECKLLTGSIGSKVKTAQTILLRNTFITHTPENEQMLGFKGC